MIALTVWLGRWQTDRGDEKEALQALLEARVHEPALDLAGPVAPPDAIVYRRVGAAGQWVAEGQVFTDNQVHEGRAGFHVITPLRIEGTSQVVLVDRGWIERTSEYPKAPRVDVPAGSVRVAGIAALPPKRYLELSSETVEGDVWQNLSIDRYRSRTGRVLPFLVAADPTALASLPCTMAGHGCRAPSRIFADVVFARGHDTGPVDRTQHPEGDDCLAARQG